MASVVGYRRMDEPQRVSDDDNNYIFRTPTTGKSLLTSLTEVAVAVILHGATSQTNHSTDSLVAAIITDVSNKYQLVLDRMLLVLSISDVDTAVQAFKGVVTKVFNDGHYNWGRVVIVLTFAGRLCRHCVDKRVVSECDVNMLTARLGQKLEECLETWLAQHAPTIEDLERLFTATQQQQQEAEEDCCWIQQHRTKASLLASPWTRLMYTAVGLGVVAVAAAAAIK